jgi:hypothetical protein
MPTLSTRQSKNATHTWLFTSVFFLIICFGFNIAKAQTAGEEAITRFQAFITVNTDNSVTVSEVITYNTGPQERHGIYRDIYPFSSEKRSMEIKDVSVYEAGTPSQFITERSGENFRIKIGDPNKTFTGEKT